MRLVATEYLSLDGIFEEPGRWSFPFFNEEAMQFKWSELQASDALLLGRKTYEGFAGAWPKMKDTGDFGVKMNSMPKHVVSSSLVKAEWAGSMVLKGDPAVEVDKLTKQSGQDLLLSGSAQLFHAMHRAKLIDLYRLMVHPIVIGKGARLFSDAVDERVLELVESKTFKSGIVILEYKPKPAAAT